MSDNDKCKSCGIEGWVGQTYFPGGDLFDDIENKPKGMPLLFVYKNNIFCNPCYCVVTNTCVHCGKEEEMLIRDKRCKNNLYLCSTCVKQPTCPHLYKCYGDGCMSPDEFAQQEYEIMQMGGDDMDITLDF